MEKVNFVREINSLGHAVVPSVIPHAMLHPLKVALETAIEKERAYQARTGAKVDYGMVLLCSLYPGPLIDVLQLESLLVPFEWILGEGCIIYAYTSSSMPPHGSNYSFRIHNDCPRLISGYMTNVGATILLDDFTEENGATWYLSGSHVLSEQPSRAEFYERARRLVAKAGSVFYFNARLWHSGGENRTSTWRHALTINMCRPFMKQRLDIPRAMDQIDLSGLSERALQKLGFLAQVPANYDEYYAPPQLRKYRQKVE
jgi:hypothetical protein